MNNKLRIVMKVLPLIMHFKPLFFKEKPVELSKHKKRDTSKFSDYHKKVIQAEYAAACIHNSVNDEKITSQDLADLLNEKFSMNKSVRSYSRIWKQSGAT